MIPMHLQLRLLRKKFTWSLLCSSSAFLPLLQKCDGKGHDGLAGVDTFESCLEWLDLNCLQTLLCFSFFPCSWEVDIEGTWAWFPSPGYDQMLNSSALAKEEIPPALPPAIIVQFRTVWDPLASGKKSQMIKKHTAPNDFYEVWLLFQQNTSRTISPKVSGEQT